MKFVPLPVAEAEEKVLDTGLLYLINKLILHRTGMALVFSGEDAEHMTSIEIMKVENEGSIEFSPELEREAKNKLLQLAQREDVDPLLLQAIALVIGPNGRRRD